MTVIWLVLVRYLTVTIHQLAPLPHLELLAALSLGYARHGFPTGGDKTLDVSAKPITLSVRDRTPNLIKKVVVNINLPWKCCKTYSNRYGKAQDHRTY